jgi:hypothetical protein
MPDIDVKTILLDGEVLGRVGDDLASVPLTAGATDAASVTFAPTGTIAATNVQAAIAEVAAEAGDAVQSGQIIGYRAWDPGTETSDAPAGTSVEDLDATNAVVTFTVPPSGAVQVRLSCMAYVTNSILMWGIREGSTTIKSMEAWETNNTNNYITSVSTTFYVSGLTPGASKTWKWLHHKGTASGTVATRYGATWGTAIMEVVAAPPAPGGTTSYIGYEGYVGSGGSLTASKPAGTATGDVIVAVITSSGGSGTPTAPAGWSAHSQVGVTGGTRVWFYWRLVGGADTTYSWTTMPTDYALASAAYRGGSTVAFGTVADATGTAPAVTAPSGGRFLYLAGIDITGPGTNLNSLPAGWTVRGETNRQWPASAIGDRTVAATAGESSGTVAGNVSNPPRTSCVTAVLT